jgi:signal transduction histidine kinase
MRSTWSVGSLDVMAANDRGEPRPPLLQRVTLSQWVTIDVAFSVLLFAAGLGDLLHQGPSVHASRWVLAVLLAGASFPNAVRRFWPLPVLACVTVCVAITTMLGSSFAPDPMLAPALYMVAVRFERRQSLVALGAVGLVLVAALLVALALQNVAGEVSFNLFLAAAVWFVGDSRRARRAYLEGLAEQAAQRQRDEVERTQRSVAEERLQIARELHDVVAHSLSVIAVQSGVGRHVLDTQPEEARKSLAAVELTSRAALNELRQMLGVLRRETGGPPVLHPTPVIADLTSLVEQVRTAGVPVELIIRGTKVPLSSSIELSVFRIVQEALTNVVKHAGPAHVSVAVTYGHEEVVIEVVDDGSGSLPTNGKANGHDVWPAPPEPAQHHGIVGMRERTAMFGGALVVGPMPGSGYRVLARLPTAAAL